MSVSNVKFFQFDSKENIVPVTITIDSEKCKLQIKEYNDSGSSLTNIEHSIGRRSTTPAMNLRSENNSTFSINSIQSYKQLSPPSIEPYSSVPNSPKIKDEQNLESISFDEIQELRCFYFDLKTANAAIVETLKSENIYGLEKSHWQYKTGVLLLGKQFNLTKHVFLVVELGNTKQCSDRRKLTGSTEWKRWCNGLMSAMEYRSMTYFEKIDLWYKSEFNFSLNETADDRLAIWKQFMSRLQFGFDDLCKEYKALEQSFWCTCKLDKDNFSGVVRYFFHSCRSANRVFQCLKGINEADNVEGLARNQTMLNDNVKNYLERAREKGHFWPRYVLEPDHVFECNKASINALMATIAAQDQQVTIEKRLLSPYYFLDYLFSEDNTIWNACLTKQYQNMDLPLSCYWINSSHNTYLTGDQFLSTSSVECYVRALRSGCRCIEIDVWNGANREPIVTHGRSWTSSVPLKDVLNAVKANAFITTHYPLVISVENHCNVQQQKTMATLFRKIFGRALVITPFETDASGKVRNLPSPNQLQKRIIIKGRQLSTNLVEHEAKTSEADIRQSIFTQTMNSGYLLNQSDCLIMDRLWNMNKNGKWVPSVFVLMREKLFYLELHENDDDNVIKKTRKFDNSHDRIYANFKTFDESNEPLRMCMENHWFHGNILGKDAADALFAHSAQNGSFYVTSSGINEGGYTLWFYANGRIHQCEIICTSESKSKRIYHLNQDPKPEQGDIFASLYDLVEYYQSHPLSITECHLKCLGQPVPSWITHATQEWFYKFMTRNEAESLLLKITPREIFLGRYGSDKQGTVVISYRNGSKNPFITHCIIRFIRNEQNYLIVVNTKFQKLEELIEQYGLQTTYWDVQLIHPRWKYALMISHEHDCSVKIYGCKEYVNSIVLGKVEAARVIESFSPSSGETSELLSFHRGDIIVGVEKTDDGWWLGLRQDELDVPNAKPKRFCSSFVEECEELEGPFGDILCFGSFNVGSGVKWRSCKGTNRQEHGIKYYLKFKFPDGSKKKLGANCSRKRILEWVDLIKCVLSSNLKKKKYKDHKIAHEFSELIIYCKSMNRLDPENIGTQYDKIDVTLVKSLDENSAGKQFRSNPTYYPWYHQYAMTRIYPKGSRVNSSNPSPVQYWIFGSQMVALNWQSDDKAMQWNRGKFKENGNCGYVLKPSILLPGNRRSESLFDPTDITTNDFWDVCQLQIHIISARLLEKYSGTKIIPVVEVELVGIDADCKKVKTPEALVDTGLYPFWDHTLNFQIRCPELALLQFSVYHLGSFSDKVLLGECTIPVNCIREGVRSVQLNNSFGEPLLSSLLVKVLKCNI